LSIIRPAQRHKPGPGPEQQAFRRLFHKQKDQHAAAASGAIFDQHLAALMATHNVRLTTADHHQFANEWDAIASKPAASVSRSWLLVSCSMVETRA